jgi:signal transduction histidine kinase
VSKEPGPVQLAIAQTIAEAHGGRLSLANRAKGGLRASITLPA